MSLLLLAPIDLFYRAPTRDDPFVLVQPHADRQALDGPDAVNPNTVIIRWATLGLCTLIARTLTPTPAMTTVLDGGALFTGLRPDPVINAFVRNAVDCPTAGLTPLLFAHRAGDQWVVYARSRHHTEDVLFLHLTTLPLPPTRTT
ncbi:hypothetical protein [Kutzneria sp. NPDC052558]|uniref:hypothetical protein n=1 Tax=Kutzneria sp. NPDC052558 TaxID=3364121 RepID=UPI0037C6AB23